MKPINKSLRFLIFLFGSSLVFSFRLFSQCSAPNSGTPQSGCPGTYTLTAITLNSNVTNHIWYTSQNGSQTITPTTNQSMGGGVWQSTYQIYFSTSTSFWVSAVCGSESSRTQVTFTATPTVSISTNTDPLAVTQANNLVLTGNNGGCCYVWYKGQNGNTRNTSVASTPTYTPTSAGTYFVQGTYCGNQQFSPPVTVNYLPVADAGPDQDISQLTSFTIYGSGSDSDGDQITYQWSQNSGSGSTTLTLSNANMPNVTISNIGITQTNNPYVLTLKVIDSFGKYSTDQVNVSVSSVSNNYTFVQEDAVLVPGKKLPSTVAGLMIGMKQSTFHYSDDLGREVETVQMQASPLTNDMVMFRVFDGLGREPNRYLPYTENANNSGTFVSINSNAIPDQHAFYSNTSTSPSVDKVADDGSATNEVGNAFSITAFEPSPLSRPVSKVSAGKYFQSNNVSKQISYTANGSNDVINWIINTTTGLPEAGYPTYYPTSELLKRIVTDEQGVASEVYSNAQGLKLLARTYTGTTWAETYYVYNKLNQLSFTLPPNLIQAVKAGGSNFTVNPTQTQVDYWAFQHKYDNVGRLVESKAPGVGWSYSVYDKRDRLILTQDANQHSNNMWSYSKYDDLNRAVVSGLYGPDNTYTTRSSMQAYVDGLNSSAGYQNVTSMATLKAKTAVDINVIAYEGIDDYRASHSISFKPGFSFKAGVTSTSLHGAIFSGSNSEGTPADVFPVGSDEALIKTYYDNYNCEICTDPNYQFVASEYWVTPAPTNNYSFTSFSRVKGNTVASSVKVLGTTTWLNTVSFYNAHGQVIQVIGGNHLGGRDRVSTLYDFSGKKLEEVQTAVGYNSGSVTTLRKVHEYFPVNGTSGPRIKNVWHQINTQPMVILKSYEYNQLGQVVKKKLHSIDGSVYASDGSAFIQKIDYRYNINSKLTNINNIPDPINNDTGDDGDDYFGLDIIYEGTLSGAGNTPRKDGMISSLRWKNDLSSKRRVYNFLYDNLDRITSSNQKMSANNSSTWDKEIDFFSETGITYDLNGNIRGLNRNQEYFNNTTTAAENIDQLSYVYETGGSNKLQYVQDNSTSADKTMGFKDGGANTLASPDYTYDANGNVTSDANKGITSITYYFNNLPNKVTINDGTYLQHTYDAAGIKLNSALFIFGQDFANSFSPFASTGTISMSLSNASLKAGGANLNDNVYFTVTTVPGHQYSVKFDTDLNGSGKISSLAYDGTNNLAQLDVTVNGTSSFQFIATTNSTVLKFINGVSGPRDFYLDNVFVQDLSQTLDYVGNIVFLSGQVLTINNSEGRITAPTYANLFINTDGSSADGFATDNQTDPKKISLSTTQNAQTLQTYVTATCNDVTANPKGIFPITTTKGDTYPVKGGETYVFKILGYQETGLTAYPYVTTNVGDLQIPMPRLPLGAANEDWISVPFLIPTGVTSIQLGIKWTSPSIGDKFYVNRVALYKTDFEYNYFVSDQVGSTRVVLQTNPGIQVYTATMESQNQSSDCTANPSGENCKFKNMDSRQFKNIVNHTGGGATSFRLDGNFPVGPAKSIQVYPGDKIIASAWSYYSGTYTSYNGTLAAIAGSVSNLFKAGASASDQAAIAFNVNSAYSSSTLLGGHTGSATAPSAYLNYILFDKDYNVISGKSFPITKTAGQFNLVSLDDGNGNSFITANELGYIYVYVSYENTDYIDGSEVYFDDFKITVQESPVIQVNNYYPFGMKSYTWLRNGETDNAYLYQGKELIAQTGWHDFGSRMYYADLGRWFAPDPQNQFSSPYSAMGNVPMMGTDPNGQFVWIPLIVGFIMGDVEYAAAKHVSVFDGKALLSGVAGAAISEVGYMTLGGGMTAESEAMSAANSAAVADAVAAGDCGLIAAGGSPSIAATVAAAGEEAATETAIDYSILYASTSAIDVAKNSDQISKSDDWRAFGLIAGYNAFAAVSAGLGSEYTEERIDKFLFGGKYSKSFFKGAISDGFGGAVHDAGNALLKGYNPSRGNGWYSDEVGPIGLVTLAGFGKGATNKLVGNSFDKLGSAFKDKEFGTYSLMLPKQIGGVLGGQMAANLIMRLRTDVSADEDFGSSDNWEGIGASWGRDYWKLLKGF